MFSRFCKGKVGPVFSTGWLAWPKVGSLPGGFVPATWALSIGNRDLTSTFDAVKWHGIPGITLRGLVHPSAVVWLGWTHTRMIPGMNHQLRIQSLPTISCHSSIARDRKFKMTAQHGLRPEIYWEVCATHHKYNSCLVVSRHPSEKYEFVSWDDYSQYMEKNPTCSKAPTRSSEIIIQSVHRRASEQHEARGELPPTAVDSCSERGSWERWIGWKKWRKLTDLKIWSSSMTQKCGVSGAFPCDPISPHSRSSAVHPVSFAPFLHGDGEARLLPKGEWNHQRWEVNHQTMGRTILKCIIHIYIYLSIYLSIYW